MILSAALKSVTPVGRSMTVEDVLDAFKKKGIEVIYVPWPPGANHREPFESTELRKRTSAYLCQAANKGEFTRNGRIYTRLPSREAQSSNKPPRMNNAAAKKTAVAVSNPVVRKRKATSRVSGNATTSDPPLRNLNTVELKAITRAFFQKIYNDELEANFTAMAIATEIEVVNDLPAVAHKILEKVLHARAAARSPLAIAPPPISYPTVREVEAKAETTRIQPVEQTEPEPPTANETKRWNGSDPPN